MLSPAKHFRIAPSLSPLDPENFQQSKAVAPQILTAFAAASF